LSKLDEGIFKLYAERKGLGKGSTRIGKNVSKVISEFVREVIHDIFDNALAHLSIIGMKKLQNKYVFGPNMNNNKYYPLYQNLACIKEYQDIATKELENDSSNSKFTKAKASFTKAKKDKPNTKTNGPTKPTLHITEYNCVQPPVKFAGCVNKIWSTFKGNYMCTELTRACLGRFVYDFTVNLIKALKVQLESSGILTFQVSHIMVLLKSLGFIHEINMDNFINLYTEKKVKADKTDETKEEAKEPVADVSVPVEQVQQVVQ
jgi:hypothetical protein